MQSVGDLVHLWVRADNGHATTFYREGVVVCHESICMKAPPFLTQEPISIPWGVVGFEL